MTAGEQLIRDTIFAELERQEATSNLYFWADPHGGKPTVDGDVDVEALSAAIADSLRRTYGLSL